MEYVKRIAGEDFASQVSRAFATSDSPFGHVDCEAVLNAFSAAL